jgi:hypothetical protein
VRRAYIEAHPTDYFLSIAAFAEAISLSPFHFLRGFQRTRHMNSSAFRQSCLVEEGLVEKGSIKTNLPRADCCFPRTGFSREEQGSFAKACP